MKLISKFIISLVIIVITLTLCCFGGYIYVRQAYGIDLFSAVNQLKILGQKVNEEELYPNIFKEEDYINLKDIVNNEIEDFIKVDYADSNQYYINYDALKEEEFLNPLSISEKQVGALSQIIFNEISANEINIGDVRLNATIVQTDFSNIDKNGSCDFSVVLKIDSSTFKTKMNQFPFYFLKKYIPDRLYISSILRVEKTLKNGFDYELSNIGLNLNTLDFNQTKNLFHILDLILKIGNIEDIIMKIGTSIVNALLGNEDNIGFVYLLKEIGARTFYFTTETINNYSEDLLTII